MKNIKRRDFITSAAIVAGASLGDGVEAAQMTAEEKANTELVAGFCAAWSTRDSKRILSFFADDGVYRMTETTPPVTGHAGVLERLGSWIESSDKGIEFKILDTYAKGPMVVNHRIDRFMSSTRPLTWEGVGVFFVKDGKIREWNDYTIKVDRPAGTNPPA
jgi:limonene-1,2-epoxide hydrolase